jgi:hypothetical protein
VRVGCPITLPLRRTLVPLAASLLSFAFLEVLLIFVRVLAGSFSFDRTVE